jgi:hypothetical protein
MLVPIAANNMKATIAIRDQSTGGWPLVFHDGRIALLLNRRRNRQTCQYQEEGNRLERGNALVAYLAVDSVTAVAPEGAASAPGQEQTRDVAAG